MCETACAFYHSGKSGRQRSRIKVLNIYELGLDGPVVCQQCQERYCNVCPVGAISIGEQGNVVISHTICNYCNKCVRACPIGAIELHEETYHICDLCGGNPRCVSACTEKAIWFEPENSETRSLSEFKDESRGKNVSQKQAAFVIRNGAPLREKWRKRNA